MSPTSVKFVAVGVVNTLVGVTTIYLTKWLLGLGDVVANAIGYSMGIILSFVLNKNWTFAYTGVTSTAFIRFVLVIITSYSLNLLTVMVAIHFVNINSNAAQALGIFPYAIFFYLASRYFAFR